MAAFGVAAIFLAVSGIAISELPGSCGEVGRPKLDLFAKLALVVGGGFWVAGAVATTGGRRATPLQLTFAAVALIELALGIGLALYYQHHVGWYGRCG